jgi:hypothetical protein
VQRLYVCFSSTNTQYCYGTLLKWCTPAEGFAVPGGMLPTLLHANVFLVIVDPLKPLKAAKVKKTENDSSVCSDPSQRPELLPSTEASASARCQLMTHTSRTHAMTMRCTCCYQESTLSCCTPRKRSGPKERTACLQALCLVTKTACWR